jgi:hypothetical protein
MELEEPEEIPTKCIVYSAQVRIFIEISNEKVNVQATIKSIDFSGRSDSRSIKTILNHISPRKMVK